MSCVALAYSTGTTRIVHLGAHTAESPLSAVLWLSLRASHVADQLDPTASRPVRAWLADERELERAVARLAAGDPYVLLICDGPDRYLLAATPSRVRTHRVPVAHALGWR